jgi:UDP-2,3-diacylglucosamine pyrophosphatase LpxH
MTELHALFLSDLHLGTRACQAERLLAFLRSVQAERIYLVGDLLDLWRFRSAGMWFPQSHVEIVRTLLGKARDGSELIYIPGNHDELLRQFLDIHRQPRLGRIQILPRAEHLGVDGRRLLVVHGDQHDGYLRILRNKPLHWLIDRAYGALTMASVATRPFYPNGGSLSRNVRSRFKRVGSYYGRFSREMLRQARDEGLQGVVCGHVHHPEMREEEGLLYMNCGDWVDNCTAIAETRDGRYLLLDDTLRGELEAEDAVHDLVGQGADLGVGAL